MSSDDAQTFSRKHVDGSKAGTSHSWQAPDVAELQSKLTQYEVIELLGRGGMGAVYKARQKSLRRLVAIKILPPEVSDDGLKFRERFQHEAETMATLSHPGIVAVHDFGETGDGLLYFVMEFIAGTDVATRMASEGALPVEEALRIINVVCDALAYAHRNGVIHRDIKPANVLIDGEGRIKVADFGLAKIAGRSMESGLTRTNVAMGTQEFAAPEQLKPGAAVDHRADIYSLGVMLYQMLTGEIPRVMFKLPSLCRPALGTGFDAVICTALETDPADRFQSVEEFRQALDAEASRAVKSKTLHRGPSRAVFASAAAGIAVCALGGWFFLGHRHGHASLPSPEKTTTNVPAPSSSTLPHNEWIKLLDTPEAVARSGINGLELEDGWLTVSPERLDLFRLAGGNGKAGDMAFRVTVRPPPNGRPVAAVLRAGGDLEFFLDVHRDWLTLRRVKHLGSSKRDDTDLGKVPLDLGRAKNGALQLEVSIQGNLITIMGDGARLMEVRDDSAAGTGDIALVAPSETKGGGKIKDIAIRLLDESAVASIPKKAAGSAAADRAIKLWDTEENTPKDKSVRWENGAVVLGDEKNKGMLQWTKPLSRDAIIRADIRTNPDAEYPQLRLRCNSIADTEDFYRLQLHGGMIVLSASERGKNREIKSWALPRSYGADEWARLELRAVGDVLTVSLDGKEIGAIRDAMLSDPGSVMIAANNSGWFRQVEYVPLDSIKAGEGASAEQQNWSDWRSVELSLLGLVPEAGGFTTDKPLQGRNLIMPTTRDAAVRVTYELRGSNGVQISAHDRGSSDTRENYVAHANFESLYIGHKIPGGTVSLLAKKVFPSETFGTGEHMLEFRVEGDTLTASLDGTLKVTAQDQTLKDGPWAMVIMKGALVKKVEFQAPTSDKR